MTYRKVFKLQDLKFKVMGAIPENMTMEERI